MNKKVLLFVSFLFGLAIFFGWMLLNQKVPPVSEEQKKRALEQTLGRSLKQEKIIPQGEQSYEGRLFSLSYPAYAQVYDRKNPNITANKKSLEYFRLDSEEPKFRFVAMVEPTDTTVLEELSAVKARRMNKQYTEISLTIDGNAGVMFMKTADGVERSSFFLKNGQRYSFVITGVDESELEKIYGQIMQSLLLK